MKLGAAALFALHQDIPATLFYDAIHRGEAEAGALAFFFGGEKWFENSGLRFLVHAHSGVAHGEHDVVARTDKGLSAAMIFIDHDIFRLHGQFSAIGHCVFSVDHEVHQYLFELPGIGARVRRLGRQSGMELDIFADQRPQQALHIFYHRIDVNDLEFDQFVS